MIISFDKLKQEVDTKYQIVNGVKSTLPMFSNMEERSVEELAKKSIRVRRAAPNTTGLHIEDKSGDNVGSAYTGTDVDHAVEYVDVNVVKGVSYEISDVNEDLLGDFSWAKPYAMKSIDLLMGSLEARAAQEVVDAAAFTRTYSTIDSNNYNEDWNKTNIATTVASIKSLLKLPNGGMDGDVNLLLDPFTARAISVLALDNASSLSADAFRNGYAGKFSGVNFVESMRLPSEFKFTVATNPAENDKIRFNGSTELVFKTTANYDENSNHIEIGASATATAANIKDRLNALGAEKDNSSILSGTTASAIFERRAFQNINKITADNSGAVVTVDFEGYSTPMVEFLSSTNVDLSTKFTTRTNKVYCFATYGKPVDSYVPFGIKTFSGRIDKTDKRYIIHQYRSAVKVFEQGKQALVKLEVSLPANLVNA